MSGDYDGFAAWVRERAMVVGFDLDARGGIAKLAAASGIDPAQMSRALRGLAVPAIEGQRGLAKALDVKLPEVMIRAGWAEPDDFDDPQQPAAIRTDDDLLQAIRVLAEAMEVLPGRMHPFAISIIAIGTAFSGRPPAEAAALTEKAEKVWPHPLPPPAG